MKKSFSIFIISTLVLNSFGQVYSVNEVKEKVPHAESFYYSFPLLTGGDTAVTKKINARIAEEILDLKLGTEKESVFENLYASANNPIARANYIEFSLELLNDSLYNVTLDGEFCGAYCEHYTASYLFELSTGEYITLDTLFNQSGKIKLLNELADYKNKRIQKQLKKLQQQLNVEDDPENKLYYKEAIELYEGCNPKVYDLQDLRFIVKKEELTIFYGRCSAHYNLALDDLMNFKKSIDLTVWEKELSKKGKIIASYL